MTVKPPFAGIFLTGWRVGGRFQDPVAHVSPLFAGKLFARRGHIPPAEPPRRSETIPGNPTLPPPDHAGATLPFRWSSCSETTGEPLARLAVIARAAAIPPEIVVMHGTPRATAARRIS